MIQNITKIKGMEFSFPVYNADKAVYRIESVNELQPKNFKTIQFEGSWGAVILAKDIKSLGYQIPEHIVFTIEYDTDPIQRYILTAITSESETAKVEVFRSAVSTPEKFFEALRGLANILDLKIKN